MARAQVLRAGAEIRGNSRGQRGTRQAKVRPLAADSQADQEAFLREQ
jgi:hypothetical protein